MAALDLDLRQAPEAIVEISDARCRVSRVNHIGESAGVVGAHVTGQVVTGGAAGHSGLGLAFAVDRPGRLLPGETWTVQMHPARLMRWKSVSTIQELDGAALRFSYRTVNADGNPSYALWRWEVTPEVTGARMSVSWDVYLETLDRRLLAGPVRRRQLRKEVAASLVSLAALAGSTTSQPRSRHA